MTLNNDKLDRKYLEEFTLNFLYIKFLFPIRHTLKRTQYIFRILNDLNE